MVVPRRLSIGSAALFVWLSGLSEPCAAQAEAPRDSLAVLLARHERGLVKLQFLGRKEEGKLLEVNDRSLTLQLEPFVTESVDLPTITHVWIAVEPTPRELIVRPAVGAVLGAALGLLFAAFPPVYCPGGCEATPAGYLGIALIGATIGSAAGAVATIGMNSWELAYPP